MGHRPGHAAETYSVVGEGVLAFQAGGRGGDAPDLLTRVAGLPDDAELPEAGPADDPVADETPAFRFSRVGPRGRPLPAGLTRTLARAMASGRGGPRGGVPAGYTYLGQLVDHDLTMDVTDVMLGDEVSPADLLQARSPALDLDSVYGAGPASEVSAVLYEQDGVHLRLGTSRGVDDLPDLPGHDLPRRSGGPLAGRRTALVADPREDENLAVAQTHLAFLHLHNAVVDQRTTDPSEGGDARGAGPVRRFRRARREVTLHYQWLLRHDYLPRICEPAVVDDVFAAGRRLVEPDAGPMNVPTMPVEFSVAAFRLGHSMVRGDYDWNARFPGRAGSLDLLFTFSGNGGDLGGDTTLISSWVADWRRLYDFEAAGRPRLAAPAGVNRAMRIDTRLTDPLAFLPPSTFGGDDAAPAMTRNLAFRNLVRAGMLRLATGQGMVARLAEVGVTVTPLTRDELVRGDGGADLSALTPVEQDLLVERTPLWFYVLREAELNDGVMTGVGARLVVETFHRALQGSRTSLLSSPEFVPTLGPRPGTFEMTDLLQTAFGGRVADLAPVR